MAHDPVLKIGGNFPLWVRVPPPLLNILTNVDQNLLVSELKFGRSKIRTNTYSPAYDYELINCTVDGLEYVNPSVLK